MRTDLANTIKRSNYQAPSHLIDTVQLHFELDPANTKVVATLAIRPNPVASGTDLILDGEGISVDSIRLDGKPLTNDAWKLDGNSLSIYQITRPAVLEIASTCHPDTNTSLSGLYLSNNNFYTQCEAQGFRRICWFLDRPDVMSLYTVTIDAPAAQFPVLLSNGNLISKSTLGNGNQRTVWQDPFPKPSYLFALVAGTLDSTEREIITASGHKAKLQFYVEPGNVPKTAHAMQALEDSVRWDEQRFGLELDLDRYMVVAVGDFNMGAMENKGLNIFNTKYVFANPQIATDLDYANIESVIGHEYFHNWTGNRVTCRDWFQLTLKEGLTVFRDQEFSADMLAKTCTDAVAAKSARAVKRIDDVRALRVAQFTEDAGPMAHPIRPDSYQEINNFYTATVYEKGAEVIRMLHTLVGEQGFRKGMDLYFQRHDGQAVTCDDFVASIADANQRDFSQFMRWYQYAGTPIVVASQYYDAAQEKLTLHFSQSNLPVGIETSSPDLKKLPLHIPVKIGLLDKHTGQCLQEHILEITEPTQSFTFLCPSPVVVSLLRGFSAPVNLQFDRPLDELAFLAEHDDDGFNRWEAIQQLIGQAIVADTLHLGGRDAQWTQALRSASKVLNSTQLDAAFKAEALGLPSESYLGEAIISVHHSLLDPSALRVSRDRFAADFGTDNAPQLAEIFRVQNQKTSGDFQANAASASARALKRVALLYWCHARGEPGTEGVINAQTLLASCNNMTDRESAILALRASNALARDSAFVSLEKSLSSEALAMDKWFQWQAGAPRLAGDTSTLNKVRSLIAHKEFQWKNPNRVRALLGAFFAGNPAEFHQTNGDGYSLWAQSVIELSSINPQVAARMARALDRWRCYTTDRQVLMKAALEKVAAEKNLPTDVAEIVTKALDSSSA